MISPASDSTQVEITPLKETNVNAPEPRRNPTTEVRRLPAAPAPGPAAAKPAPAAPRPPTALNVPAVQRPAAAAPAATDPDEDPEKFLKEYTDRQKVKIQRLEQQLADYKRVITERDSFKAKGEALSKELIEAKKQLEGAGRAEEIIKDLQGKVDAAILSNSILADEKEKLKKGLSQQTEHFKKSEERAAAAEKSLAETQKQLAAQTEARRESEARVAAAVDALQGAAKPAAKPATEKQAVHEAQTRPIEAPKASEEKPAPAKPAAGRAPTAPGRFSFLKK